MEELSHDVNEVIARLRQQDRDFEQEQYAVDILEEDNRRPSESLSEEILHLLLIGGRTEEINAIKRIQNDIRGIEDGIQYMNEIIADVRNLEEETGQENDIDDNEVIDEDNDVNGEGTDLNGEDNEVNISNEVNDEVNGEEYEVIVIDDDSDDDNVVIEIDDDGDDNIGDEEEDDEEDEQDIEWDEFSVSDHSTDSGFVGSHSDISDATFYSAYSDELVHNEVCHFGFLVYPQHVREPVHIQPEALPGTSSQSPRGMSNSDIQNWLENTEFAVKSGQKRKRDDSDDEVDDNVQCEPRRKKFRRIIRQSRSETCVQNENIVVKRSFSHAFLL